MVARVCLQKQCSLISSLFTGYPKKHFYYFQIRSSITLGREWNFDITLTRFLKHLLYLYIYIFQLFYHDYKNEDLRIV